MKPELEDLHLRVLLVLLAIQILVTVVTIIWTSEKPSQKIILTSQFSGFLIGSNGLIYSKSRA